MEETKKINLTSKNLLRYGEIVLMRDYNSDGAFVTERFVIWRESKVPQMWLHVMVDGHFISMKKL